MATVEQARQAKKQVSTLLRDVPEVNGVGVTRIGDGWAVRVNLLSVPARSVPSMVDGVPVESQVVGPATAHAS